MMHEVTVHYTDGHYALAYSGGNITYALATHKELVSRADVSDVTLISEPSEF